ncbi:MAG: (deoxy)nucleoside triphosphate pyrophosphohydrolase [Bacilli bacterium]|nr:(deoxy)nucleoside triphosphate pyrophosphohydrolase [Bacilli bacterium]
MKHVEVVCALIENDEGKIFCCKRGPGRALEGFWEFPGGKVEVNETHEETIIREIKEELNSIVEPIEYLGVSNYIYKDMPPYAGFSITMYGYRCKLISGKLELSEHIESKWASKEEMQKMNFAEADKPFLK